MWLRDGCVLKRARMRSRVLGRRLCLKNNIGGTGVTRAPTDAHDQELCATGGPRALTCSVHARPRPAQRD